MSTDFTPHRVIAPNATASIREIVAQHMPARSLLLVCDDTTWVAAGEKIRQHLGYEDYETVTPYSLGRHVHATMEAAQAVAAQASTHDAVIAIGAGTVNDISKYAAATRGKPYISVATAASMNGYSSATASLEEHGLKHSFPADLARAVIADTTIIAAAPKRLTRAGLGDTLCRTTVEADMLISHWLLGTDYPRALFDMLRRHEDALIANAAATRDNSPELAAQLMEALLDAGDAMAIHRTSGPASQGEHMMAHTLEVMYGSEIRALLHGEMIAVTSLSMSHLQHKMLLGQPVVKSIPRDQTYFERQFGKKTAPILRDRYAKKTFTPEQVTEINARITTHWPEIRAALTEIMLPSGVLQRTFIKSGLACTAKEIRLDEDRYRNACNSAYLTRDRFTFLDLAAMNGKAVA